MYQLLKINVSISKKLGDLTFEITLRITRPNTLDIIYGKTTIDTISNTYQTTPSNTIWPPTGTRFTEF